MAKDSTISTINNGDDVDDTWADQVKETAEGIFLDKTVYVETYASSLEIDLNNGALQLVELAGDITVTLANQKLNRPFCLIFLHDGTSRTINLFGTIRWAYNYTPISSQPNKYDVFLFIPINYDDPDWTYLGFVVGQEM